MVSEKFCSKGLFNPGLFRKNLRRFWPLWLGLSLIWALMLPTDLLSTFARREINPAALRETVLNFTHPAVLLGGATGLVASLCVFQPLFSQKATFAYHALPIRREGLWLTNCLSGLAIALIPAVVNGILVVAAEVGSTPGLDRYSIGALTAVLAASAFFGFALGALCASVTGSLPAAVVFFVLANCVVALAWLLLCALVEPFAKGIVLEPQTDWLTWATPVWKLMEDCGPAYDSTANTWLIKNLWVYGVYCGVGVLFLLVGGILYHIRSSEHAGDVIAFSWLRPLFAIGLSLGVGVGLTVCLLEIYCYGESPLGLTLGLLALGTFVGWVVARMLLIKSFRVFDRKTFAGWGILFAALVLVLGAAKLDVLGIQSRVPRAETVQNVELDYPGQWTARPEQVIALHQALVDYDGDTDGNWVRFSYTLTNGSTLTREYQVPDQDQSPEIFALYADLCQDPAGVLQRVLPEALREDPKCLTMIILHQSPEEAILSYDDTPLYDAETTYYGERARAILDALIRDIQAGNYQDLTWIFDDAGSFEYTSAWLELSYRATAPDGTRSTETDYLDLYAGMTNTLEALGK